MDKLNNKSLIKIILAIIVGLAGLLTVIFSILNLAKVDTVSSESVLRVLIGVLLMIVGVSTSLLIIFSNPESVPFDLLSGGLFIGLGIYLIIEKGTLNSIVGKLFPIIVACFGGLTLIKGIVDAVKKSNNKYVLNIIIASVLLICGILFAVFNKELKDVVWLLLGIAIIVLSIGEIVFTLKGKPRVKIIKNNNNQQ